MSGSSFEYVGLARWLFFCRIFGVRVKIAGGARKSVFDLETECSGFPLARGSSLKRTSGTVGACWDFSRLSNMVGVPVAMCVLVLFGGRICLVFLLSGAHGNWALGEGIKNPFTRGRTGRAV